MIECVHMVNFGTRAGVVAKNLRWFTVKVNRES